MAAQDGQLVAASQQATDVVFPTGVVVVAWVCLAVAVGCAIWTALDLRDRPPRMGVMRVVWPVCMLFGSVLWLAFYLRWGRAPRRDEGAGDGGDGHGGGNDGSSSGPERPRWVSVATSTSHCGAGCTLGDLTGEWLVVAVPALAAATAAFGNELLGRWTLDLLLAFGFGIALQYFAIAPMRGLGVRQGLVEALKADTFSILAWQVGMYAVMALAQLVVLPALVGGPAPVTSAVFWWIMQIAMLAGFVTSYPVNAVLLRRGIKEPM